MSSTAKEIRYQFVNNCVRISSNFCYSQLPCSASQRRFSVSDSRASKTAAPTSKYVNVHTIRDIVRTFCFFMLHLGEVIGNKHAFHSLFFPTLLYPIVKFCWRRLLFRLYDLLFLWLIRLLWLASIWALCVLCLYWPCVRVRWLAARGALERTNLLNQVKHSLPNTHSHSEKKHKIHSTPDTRHLTLDTLATCHLHWHLPGSSLRLPFTLFLSKPQTERGCCLMKVLLSVCFCCLVFGARGN